MRKLGLSTAVIGAGMLATGLAANAQFFNYSATFTPTSMQVAGPGGNYGYNITNGSNLTGSSTPTNITLGTLVANAPNCSTSTVGMTTAVALLPVRGSAESAMPRNAQVMTPNTNTQAKVSHFSGLVGSATSKT